MNSSVEDNEDMVVKLKDICLNHYIMKNDDDVKDEEDMVVTVFSHHTLNLLLLSE